MGAPVAGVREERCPRGAESRDDAGATTGGCTDAQILPAAAQHHGKISAVFARLLGAVVDIDQGVASRASLTMVCPGRARCTDGMISVQSAYGV